MSMSAGVSAEAHSAETRARRLKRWLVLSLALNLLIAGVVAGTLVMAKRQHGVGKVGVAGDGYSLFGFSRTLSADRGREIRRELLKIRKDLRPLRDDYRSARLGPADMLAAEPFDRERVKSAFAGVDQAEGRYKTAGRERLLDILAAMPLAERQELAAWWKARMSTRFSRRDRDAGKADEDTERGK